MTTRLYLKISFLSPLVFFLCFCKAQSLKNIDSMFVYTERAERQDGSYTEVATKPLDSTEARQYFFNRMNSLYGRLAQSYIDSIYIQRDIRRDKMFLDTLSTSYVELSNEEYKPYYLGEYFIRYKNNRYECEIETSNSGQAILRITDTLFVADQYVLDDRGRVVFWSGIDLEIRNMFESDIRFFQQSAWRREDVPFLDDQEKSKSILNEYRYIGLIGWFSDGTKVVIRRKKKDL